MTISLEKPEMILAGARSVFLEYGYAAATTNLIQRRAGVSKATVYAHYPSKAALFAAVVASECQRFSEAVQQNDLERHPIGEILRCKGRHFMDLIQSPTAIALFRIVTAEAPRFPELGQAFYQAGPEQAMTKIAGYLELAISRNELTIPEPLFAAECFLQMLCGHLHLRQLLEIHPFPSADEVEEKVTKVVESFLKIYRV